MKEYNHKKIEKKWQAEWEKSGIYTADDASSKPKFYSLIEFPFPSGDGMHTGHLRSNTAMDIISRKRRAEGYNVLYPIGWDAFGLPTENYAIKTGQHPADVTKKNTDNFRKQLKSAGFSFDWSREINTTDPTYYKWTQWIFLQMYEKNLAYKKRMLINWCPKDKIGLANEEVIAGKCERCGTEVEKREKEQWMLAITKYADRLDKDLDTVDYQERIKTQQRNWIGKSEGAEIEFAINNISEKIKVFTTRPDTLFGVTYVVLSPEHELITKLKDKVSNIKEVEDYIQLTKKKTEIERTNNDKEKTGIELKGVKAINPATGEEIPMYVADYVLAHYGTGAIMAVPAHDERDFAFATKFKLPIKEVVSEGILINSGEYSGVSSDEAKKKIAEKYGKIVTTYKLRDWVFSRQRYWGEPIPMIHCEKCGIVPVPEKDLPVELPNVKNYLPTDTGESPLAAITEWVNVKCPTCKGDAKRETDTMPNWAGSSWYFLRYIDPANTTAFADAQKLKYWMPIDWYNGGMEHTTLHLLYSRFWNKFLFDIGVVPVSEPYKKRTSHGLIMAEDGEKMSKSRGNVVSPDAIIENYGADTLRVYEMFMGPFDQPVAWSMDSIIGPRRFLERVWKLHDKVVEKVPFDAALESEIHKTIKKVSEDIESMAFNTAVSSLMILLNSMEKKEQLAKSYYKHFLVLLAPFAPHITEELWEAVGEKESIHLHPWPVTDESKIKGGHVTIVVQVNGKMRGEFVADPTITEDEARQKALNLSPVIKWTEGKEIKKVIFVKGKLVNIVAV